MVTYILILLVIAALLISPVVYGYWRKRNMEKELGHPLPPSGNTVGNEKPAQRTNFTAASVVPGENACEAALSAKGKRSLTEDSYRLPLDACDRIQECTCTFQQHSDRRDGGDRRNEFGSLSTSGTIGSDFTNQRSGLERRQNSESDLDDLDYE
jgi:hypothetical protein